MRLRDRDAILTKEGLIFRVLGYSHPPQRFTCDLEYASSNIFSSEDPRALRAKGSRIFCKFYEDECWRFLSRNMPEYLFCEKTLGRKLISVAEKDIEQLRNPQVALRNLLSKNHKDSLVRATETVLRKVTKGSSVKVEDFGVFGSLLHDFYHLSYSDIDLTIYGRQKCHVLLDTLRRLYESDSSVIKNEFDKRCQFAKQIRFKNLNISEFLWHQRRKFIYGVFHDDETGRLVKVEFEPVRDWPDILNEYDPKVRISNVGWIRMHAKVARAADSMFMPSVYEVEPIEILEGLKVKEKVRVVSYLEEFRLQAFEDELIYVEGNLEQVKSASESLYQIVLTFCPKYYEQCLKVV